MDSTRVSRPGRYALWRTPRAAILCVVATSAWATGPGAAAQELRLTSKQALCLADNAELLLRDKGDPVTFYFDLCLADTAARGGSRQTLPDVPKPASKSAAVRQRSDGGPVKISKAYLRCIQDKKSQEPAFLETNPVLLNPAACQK